MSHRVHFQPSGRGKAQCAPNPLYPKGIALDGSKPGQLSCTVTLPYPAPECGMWLVFCDQCPMSVMITAAGRIDDPVSVRVRCQLSETPEGPTPDTMGAGEQAESLQVNPKRDVK